MIGREISRRRKAAGLSQEALALLIGARQSYISSVENGKRLPGALLPRIAKALGTTAEALSSPSTQVGYAEAVVAWNAADPSTRGERPVRPGARYANGHLSPWRGEGLARLKR